MLPTDETSWMVAPDLRDALIGTTAKLIVTQVDERYHLIATSLRRLEPDPWQRIQSELPRGLAMRAMVVEVRSDGVRVELPNDLPAYIPRQYVEEAGRSYADVTADLRPGTPLDVEVSHVFVSKQKVRVSLPNPRFR